ncbi:MAG: tyrosine--tRNA ligase [Alphaproteobacteria bacterium]|nr:tyrosine--tRNA ligase [Alphaproteobacteria bacterium]
MNTEERLNLIKRNTEEIIGEDELRFMLESGQEINHYIGFEISGKLHIGQAVIVMQKVKDLMDAGVKVHLFLADWHSYLNDKFGGNLEIIKEIADGAFKEILKASILTLGGDPEKLTFIKASEYYATHPDFWLTFLEVSKNTSLPRIERSISIMGREEGQTKDFGSLAYPPMQAADIFAMNIQIAQGGIDQRKIHVIMRDTADKIKTNMPMFHGKRMKPVAIHTPLLPSLAKPAIWPIPEDMNKRELLNKGKMSKSDPNSAMFMMDDPEAIRKKIMKGFCMEKEIGYNPILRWFEMIVFPREKSGFKIVRPEEHGGIISFKDFKDLESKFEKGDVHPIDVKNFLADYLIEMFKPAREHFQKPAYKKMLDRMEEILGKIKAKSH